MRGLLIFFLALIFSSQLSAQHFERYYDFEWKPCDASSARFFSYLEKKDTGWFRRDYFLREKALQMVGSYKDQECQIRHGKFYFYHPNKQLSSVGNYSDNKKEGTWLNFFEDGTLSDSSFYRNDNVIGTSLSWYPNTFLQDSAEYNEDGSGIAFSWYEDGTPSLAGRYTAGYKKHGKWQYFHHNGKPSAIETYANGTLTNKTYFNEDGSNSLDTTDNDRPAMFTGGSKAWGKFLNKELYFPMRYQITNNDKAVVIVSGIVNEDGAVSDVQVTVPLHPEFDKIALDAVKKSPKWQPAISHNRRVRYRFTQTIYFSQENFYH